MIGYSRCQNPACRKVYTRSRAHRYGAFCSSECCRACTSPRYGVSTSIASAKPLALHGQPDASPQPPSIQRKNGTDNRKGSV